MAERSIIIIGNTGVGKSFVVNCLLDDEVFASEERSIAVTSKLEFRKILIEDVTYKIYNIPGLLEDDEEKVKNNKKAIMASLDNKEEVYVFYMLTVEGGRLRSNDLDAYRAFSKAYEVKTTAFAFLVNKYENKETLKPSITHRIQTVLSNSNVYYLPKVAESFENDKQLIQGIMISAIKVMVPHTVRKIGEIVLAGEEIKEIHKLMKEQLVKYEEMIAKNKIEYEKQLGLLKSQLVAQQQKHDAEVADLKKRQGRCLIL